LSAFSLSVEERVAVNFAEEALIGQCMRDAGFEYDVPQFAELLESEQKQETLRRSRLYGITDRAAAAEYGYDPPPDPSNVQRKHRELSDAYQVALIGTSDLNTFREADSINPSFEVSGCVGAARLELGYAPVKSGQNPDEVTDIGDAGDLAEALRVSTWNSFAASKDWSDIVAGWVNCMVAKGWNVEDPVFEGGDMTAITKQRAEEGSSTPSAREIELALDDVTCKEETDLVRRLREANDKWERDAIERRATDLQENRKHLDEVVRRANQVVEEFK
jgi:hypothetical protein